MSAFKPQAATHRNSGDRSSLSSLSLKGEKPSKQPKSLMKCHRTVDPKLRIRPFRSKVTFSEDTKTGDSPEKRVEVKYIHKWDSSSESIADEPISLKRQRAFSDSTSAISSAQQSALKLSDVPFADLSKRRQSLDPSIAMASLKAEELTKDNWLHYQSLPNIQEEDQQQTSPTEISPPDVLASAIHDSSPIFPVKICPPSPANIQRPLTPTINNEPTAEEFSNIQNVLLTPPHSFDQSRWSTGEKRRSIKRQKSQDLPDEDPKPQKLPPPLPQKSFLNKQSSDESQTSNMTDNSSSSTNQLKGTSASMLPGILRRPKEDLKSRQASTESDTASYHTVNSYMQVEKSLSSSIDSFTSAISESNNASLASNGSSHPIVPASRDDVEPSTQVDRGLPNGSRYLSSFSPIEHSTLVPKITFSQSTPSVTSQSSDDQNSPKWDEPHAEFSSLETVMEAAYQKQPKVRPDSVARPAIKEASGLHSHSPVSSSSSSVSSLSSGIPSTPCESLHLIIQDPDESEKSNLSHPVAMTNPETSTAIVPNNIQNIVKANHILDHFSRSKHPS